MVGIHWRFDGQEGLLLGEMAAVRILQQVREHTHPRQPRRTGYTIPHMSLHRRPFVEVGAVVRFHMITLRLSGFMPGFAKSVDRQSGGGGGLTAVA